jgi:formylglycine-generating enzyme required for sulfatase activity
VPVRGGRTRIGSTLAEVEDLIKKKPDLAMAVAGEAPQFTMEVEDFLLMPTEVTNEQYQAFVLATALTAALPRGRALRDDGPRSSQRAPMRRSGTANPSGRGRPAAWGEEHWHGAWEPPAELTHPVVTSATRTRRRALGRAAPGDRVRVPAPGPWRPARTYPGRAGRQRCQSLHRRD